MLGGPKLVAKGWVEETDFNMWSMSGSLLEGPLHVIPIHLPLMNHYYPPSMAEGMKLREAE